MKKNFTFYLHLTNISLPSCIERVISDQKDTFPYFCYLPDKHHNSWEIAKPASVPCFLSLPLVHWGKVTESLHSYHLPRPDG